MLAGDVLAWWWAGIIEVCRCTRACVFAPTARPTRATVKTSSAWWPVIILISVSLIFCKFFKSFLFHHFSSFSRFFVDSQFPENLYFIFQFQFFSVSVLNFRKPHIRRHFHLDFVHCVRGEYVVCLQNLPRVPTKVLETGSSIRVARTRLDQTRRKGSIFRKNSEEKL